MKFDSKGRVMPCETTLFTGAEKKKNHRTRPEAFKKMFKKEVIIRSPDTVKNLF